MADTVEKPIESEAELALRAVAKRFDAARAAVDAYNGDRSLEEFRDRVGEWRMATVALAEAARTYSRETNNG
jgi:hypothetical protein